MPNLFYAGQPDYIEKLNTLATTESVTDGSLAASFLSLVVAGLSTFGGGLQVDAQASAPDTPDTGFTVFADASDIPGWKGANGFVVKLNATANTADRTYTLPNASGTFALLSSAQTFTAAQTVSINSASAALTLTQAGAGAALSTNGQIVSTLGTGTAPFSVVSTTVVANLNAALLNGATFAAPGTIGGTTPGAATFTTLTATGQASFAAGSAAAPAVKVGAEQNGLYSSAANTLDVALNGVRQFQFGYTASAVNYLQATGSTTGNEARLSVQGSDTNAGMWLTTKGNGVIRMETGGGEQFRVAHTANAVNYATITGSATGNAVLYGVAGTDANIPFAYYTKGSGSHLFFANSGLQMLVGATASPVNYWQFFGAATGGALNMYAGGSDTNIAVVQNTKGTGSHFFRTNGGAQTQLEVVHVASAVNRLQIGGGATGVSPYVIAAGSDAVVNIYYGAKSSGSHVFATGAGLGQVYMTHTANAVNFVGITGAATGNSVVISTGGTDANRSITLTAAGTGTVNVTNPLGLQRYTVATLPAATTDRLIIVSDESGGLVPAFSDGTNWRRVTDRAIVS